MTELADVGAERVVLGACLLAPELSDDVAGVLVDSDWYDLKHAAIWASVRRMRDAGEPVDLVSVARDLAAGTSGVRAHDLVALADATPATAHWREHATAIRLFGARRRLVAECRRVASEAQGDLGDQSAAGAWLDNASGRLQSACEAVLPRSCGATLAEASGRVLGAVSRRQSGDSSSDTPVVRIGPLADLVPRWRVGLHVIAARPGMGKSALAYQVAVESAADGHGVVYLSLEMSEADLASRHLSAVSGVPFRAIDGGTMTAAQHSALVEAHETIRSLPIVLEYAPRSTPTTIRAAVRAHERRLRAEYGVKLGMIVVDYLQLATASGRHDNRQVEVSTISRELTVLAGEWSVPVLALSQLNRSAESRADNRPALGDLRESGSLEQDATTVILLFRPGYYSRDDSDHRAEAIVAKQRNFPAGVAHLAWNGPAMRFAAPADWTDRNEVSALGDEFDDYEEGGESWLG